MARFQFRQESENGLLEQGPTGPGSVGIHHRRNDAADDSRCDRASGTAEEQGSRGAEPEVNRHVSPITTPEPPAPGFVFLLRHHILKISLVFRHNFHHS